MSYKEKYLKYKTKYLILKKQRGGEVTITFIDNTKENEWEKIDEGDELYILPKELYSIPKNLFKYYNIDYILPPVLEKIDALIFKVFKITKTEPENKTEPDLIYIIKDALNNGYIRVELKTINDPKTYNIYINNELGVSNNLYITLLSNLYTKVMKEYDDKNNNDQISKWITDIIQQLSNNPK